MYIIIVGAGKVGEYLARTTVEGDHEVAVIETDTERADQLATSLGNSALVINGDGCDSHYLEDADIRRADIFVAATGRDDNNLVACEIAKRVYNAKRCIARVNNPKNLRIFRKLGIESISSTTLIARLIEEEATLGSMNAVSTLTQGNIGLIEVPVAHLHISNPMDGMNPFDIEMPEGSLIVAVVQSGEVKVVSADIEVHVGDTLIVAADVDSMHEARVAIKGL